MVVPIRRAVVLASALVIVAAACGGEDEPAEPAEPAASATSAAPSTNAPAPSDSSSGRTVQAGDSVSVHYVGTLDDGSQFDSSRDRGQPLSFVSQAGQMIPGFDAAVVGMAVGETKTVRLEPADAYGEWTEDRIQTVEVGLLPEDVAVGDEIFASTGQRFVILEIGDAEARLDGNHELAGEALTFEIEVFSIEE